MNNAIKVVATVALAMGLASCARNVEVMSSPNLNVYTSYADKVPGKWALFVQGPALNRDVHTDGLACAAYSYPLKLESSFRQSVAGTFRNLVMDIDVLDQAPTMDTIRSGGYRGLIRVSGDDLRTHLTFMPGFFTSTAEVGVEIDAGVIVETPVGRVLGTQATGTGRSDHDAGAFCSGTAPALSAATAQAIKAVVGQLGERFSNSVRVRSATN